MIAQPSVASETGPVTPGLAARVAALDADNRSGASAVAVAAAASGILRAAPGGGAGAPSTRGPDFDYTRRL